MTTFVHGQSISRTGFGFDDIMAEPDYTPFRTWWNENSFFSLTREDIEGAFSSPQDDAVARETAWTVVADAA